MLFAMGQKGINIFQHIMLVKLTLGGKMEKYRNLFGKLIISGCNFFEIRRLVWWQQRLQIFLGRERSHVSVEQSDDVIGICLLYFCHSFQFQVKKIKVKHIQLTFL